MQGDNNATAPGPQVGSAAKEDPWDFALAWVDDAPLPAYDAPEPPADDGDGDGDDGAFLARYGPPRRARPPFPPNFGLAYAATVDRAAFGAGTLGMAEPAGTCINLRAA